MKLLPPTIIGPVSECNTKVQVKGQFNGAIVSIFAGDIVVGQRMAPTANELVPLNISLSAHQKLTVTQQLGSDVSKKEDSIIIEVQRRPATIGQLTLSQPLYVCGRALRLLGSFPGSEITVRENNTIRGTGNALGSEARVELSQPMQANQPLTAIQQGCNIQSPPSSFGATLHPPSILPLVTIGKIYECQPSFYAGNVIPGAVVEFYKNGSTFGSYTFDSSAVWVAVSDHFFAHGDRVNAVQFMCGAKLSSNPNDHVIVQIPAPIPVPSIIGPICPNSKTIHVTGLILGSMITVFEDNVEIGNCQAPGPEYDVPVGSLRTNSIIAVTQSYCNKASRKSNAIRVQENHSPVSTQVIGGPLYECAVKVFVHNIIPGTTVTVISDQCGPISAPALINGSEADINVAPALIKNDVIRVRISQCGGTNLDSDPVRVKGFPISGTNAPTLNPVVINTPVMVSDPALSVSNVFPSSLLDIYVDNIYVKTVFGRNTSMFIPFQLRNNTQIAIIERFCALSSKSNTVTVQWPEPEKPILDYPWDGDTGVPLDPIFSWSDPGQSDPFKRAIGVMANIAIDQGQEYPSSDDQIIYSPTVWTGHKQKSDLLPNTKYIWAVGVINGGQLSASTVGRFMTGDGPSPVVFLVFEGSIFLSDDGVTVINNLPANTDTIAWQKIKNLGSLTAVNYRAFWRFLNADTETEISNATVNLPEMAMNDETTVQFGVPGQSTGHFRIEIQIQDNFGNPVSSIISSTYFFN